MIPKVIHYCWFGNAPLPGDVKKCIASWEKHCPDFRLQRWDEHNFDPDCHPFVRAAYDAGCWAFVSDYARLKVVYDQGGIYLDTDVELLKSLEPLLGDGCYFGVEQNEGLVATGLGFGAEAHHPAVHAMLKQYDSLCFDPAAKERLACPLLNDRALRLLGLEDGAEIRHVAGAVVYPPRFFDPLAPGNTRDLTCPDTVSIHHYSASWTCPQQRLKRKLIRLAGERRIQKLKAFLKK